MKKKLLLIASVIVLAYAAWVVVYNVQHANKTVTTESQPHPTVQGIATDVNIERQKAGLSPLKEDARLDKSSKAHCDDMLAANVYNHNMPDGRTPLDYILADWGQTAGFLWGENNSYGWPTSYDVVNGWMGSPDHEANILNESFVAVGYGVCKATDYTSPGIPRTDGYLIVQQFVGV